MSDDDLLDEGGGGGAPGALPGGGGSGLELPLREGETDELELFGEGGLKPGGFMAGPLAPPVPGFPLSPAAFNFGIPPAKLFLNEIVHLQGSSFL